MKNIKSVGLALVLALLAVVACQPEEVIPVGNDDLAEESLIVTSSEEVDAMLVTAYGSADFTLEEKLNFLSDYFAKEYTEKLSTAYRGASTNLYVAVAQIFDGTTYFTDVDTGDGSGRVSASEFELRHDQIAFAGCNANVYLNGNNIGGDIFSVSNLVYIGEEISLWARASWTPTVS
ncbi:MAG: hypothetical protein AAFQ98_12625, partial [Bacteroidota bacterium]